MKHGSFRRTIWIALAVSAGLACGASAQPDPDIDTLGELSLEELLNVEVTSVSKRAEPKTAAPAAIYVITSEDIRRSPARTIPDLLRTVPGLHVAKLDGNKWSVTARGFGGRFSNKLLVLIDGQSVYTGVFSGVYWETQMTPLPDIARIEIVRGPGGTLWGANAVNGVISIVTKHAEETQGGLLELGGGKENEAFGTLRYGGKLSDDAFYRVYAEHAHWDESAFEDGSSAHDGWHRTHGGFRIDWNPTERDTFMVSGNIYEARVEETLNLTLPYFPYSKALDTSGPYSGFGAVAQWRRALRDDGALQVQLAIDQYETEFVTLDERVRTFDLEFQHEFATNGRHKLVWGLGFRYTDMEFETSRQIDFGDDNPRNRLFSAFLQDTISLGSDWRLILGTKIEHNDHTGLEIQPNARLAWTPSDRTTLWASVSRAVRTPSQSEEDVELLAFTGPRLRAILYGDDDYDSESVIAYELGLRRLITERFAIDAAMFYNEYDNLRTVELRAPYINYFPFAGGLVIPFSGANNLEAKTFGLELTADWETTDWWRLRASYSYLNVDLDLNTRAFTILSDSADGDTPSHQFTLESLMSLPKNVELDTTLRYVDDLPALDVDDYLALDVRLGWRPLDNLEVSLIGTDLLDSERLEYRSSFVDTAPTERQRGVYGKVTWTF